MVRSALADDFHTPKTVQAILKLIADGNKMFKEKRVSFINI